jgi:hypothetical protein
MKISHYLFLAFVFFVFHPAQALDNKNIEYLATPPPDDVFVAAKIDPKLYKFSSGVEFGWAFANPFIDDYSLGLNLNYLPVSQVRLGLVGSYHASKSTGLSKQVDEEIGLKDRKLRLAKPQVDLLAHFELRAIHGIVKLFHIKTLDYEAGLFCRFGARKSTSTTKGWDLLIVPGLSQTLLFAKSFNIRLLLSAELQNDKSALVTQGAVIQGGFEWRY